MAGILVKAGDDIPLFHQLGEYTAGKFIEAVIIDDNGAPYLTIDLIDRGDGMYTAKTPMPSKNLIATYKTYEDIGKTVLSEILADVDIFILDSLVTQRRDDKIVGVIETNEVVAATLSTAEVIGLLNSNEAIGSIEGEKELLAEFEEKEITASFKCL